MTEMLGKKFGLLTVKSSGDRRDHWRVTCDCGIAKIVRGDHLRSGKTISCGCEHKRRATARAAVLHAANMTHGMSRSAGYDTWRSMKQRCLNPNNHAFDRYGGRGITVCQPWLEFENFLADMGQPPEGMTLERIDNNGHYAPGNCKWATREEQMNNRECNREFTINGRTKTLAQWARDAGVKRNTVEQRLATGETIEKALGPGRRVNLAQVRAAAHKSRIARLSRTHCKHGHEWTLANTGWQKTGRFCRECHRQKVARQQERKRLARVR